MKLKSVFKCFILQELVLHGRIIKNETFNCYKFDVGIRSVNCRIFFQHRKKMKIKKFKYYNKISKKGFYSQFFTTHHIDIIQNN